MNSGAIGPRLRPRSSSARISMAVDELPSPRLYGCGARLATGFRRELERSIDEYLACCKEDAVELRKPYSGELTVRVGSEFHGADSEVAAAGGMSIDPGSCDPCDRLPTPCPIHLARSAAQAASEHGEGVSARPTSESLESANKLTG